MKRRGGAGAGAGRRAGGGLTPARVVSGAYGGFGLADC